MRNVKIWMLIGAASTFLLVFPDQLHPFVVTTLAGATSYLLKQCLDEPT